MKLKYLTAIIFGSLFIFQTAFAQFGHGGFGIGLKEIFGNQQKFSEYRDYPIKNGNKYTNVPFTNEELKLHAHKKYDDLPTIIKNRAAVAKVVMGKYREELSDIRRKTQKFLNAETSGVDGSNAIMQAYNGAYAARTDQLERLLAECKANK